MLAWDTELIWVKAAEPATPTLEAPTPEMAWVEMVWPTPSSSLRLPNLSASRPDRALYILSRLSPSWVNSFCISSMTGRVTIWVLGSRDRSNSSFQFSLSAKVVKISSNMSPKASA